ncbi:hypothetical protein [Siccibacter colletis]|uniref:hypothetical protein n=1 Tax=Siccibacter colletis TaxID=1505757 RepID=UPI0004E199BE|nr:hypothetical protein [Siccibacter colletis]
MTKFTKERLEEIHAEYSRPNHSKSFSVKDVEIAEMARRLLAAEAQEPVAEVVLGEQDDEGCYPRAYVKCLAGDGCADWDNFPDGFKLYAAPQAAQQLQLPEALIPYPSNDKEQIAYNAGWNAYRAAMLKSAQPVQVPDGWKLVPVDPTETMLAAAGDIVILNADEALSAYKAMLSAAPQHRSRRLINAFIHHLYLRCSMDSRRH